MALKGKENKAFQRDNEGGQAEQTPEATGTLERGLSWYDAESGPLEVKKQVGLQGRGTSRLEVEATPLGLQGRGTSRLEVEATPLGLQGRGTSRLEVEATPLGLQGRGTSRLEVEATHLGLQGRGTSRLEAEATPLTPNHTLKDAITQTDATPVTLSSWKILKTRSTSSSTPVTPRNTPITLRSTSSSTPVTPRNTSSSTLKDTSSNTPRNTLSNTSSDTPRNTLSNTPITPSNTPRNTLSNTSSDTPMNTLSNTPITPSNTPRNTLSNTSSDTPRNTLSNTPITPSNTSSNTPSNTSSNTPDYIILETKSLGFDATTQTKDALLFRFSDVQVEDMVLAWQMLTVFVPCTWYLILYVIDQVTSVVVAVELCGQGQDWWCGLTVTFLVLPSLVINAYAYEQLTRPDIASVTPLNKWAARLLFLSQLAPHYLIGRKVSWCYRAWRAESWTQKTQTQPHHQRQPHHQPHLQPHPHKTPQVLWEQATAETDSSTAKWFQSLLESVPQLSIQSYVMMFMLQRQGQAPASVIASVIVSLTSASSGLASVMSDKAWERFAAALAIILTLGSRVLVCSGIGTIHPALWFTPVGSATLLGLLTKISESKEPTYKAIITKTHKYMFEAFIMAAVCPPFNTLGLFTSVPYVLAGVCFLTLNPSAFVNISVFILSVLGQIIWLAVGFFVIN